MCEGPLNSWKLGVELGSEAGPPGSTAHWSYPVPGTVVIPEDVLVGPYQGAALLSSPEKGSTFLRGDCRE